MGIKEFNTFSVAYYAAMFLCDSVAIYERVIFTIKYDV